MKTLVLAVFTLCAAASAAEACTCVTAGDSKETQLALSSATTVFRATAISAKTLPAHPQMRGRDRYAVTFRVAEYWKGKIGRMMTLYVLEPGPDCHGGRFQPGKEYLIFASEETARDVKLDDFFWYGWLDVLAEGTPMLAPITACAPTGETSMLRKELRELGKGRAPAKD